MRRPGGLARRRPRQLPSDERGTTPACARPTPPTARAARSSRTPGRRRACARGHESGRAGARGAGARRCAGDGSSVSTESRPCWAENLLHRRASGQPSRPREERRRPRPAGAGRGRRPSAPPHAEHDEGGHVGVLTGEQPVCGRDVSTPRDPQLLPERVAVRLRRPRRDPQSLAHLVVRPNRAVLPRGLGLPYRDFGGWLDATTDGSHLHWRAADRLTRELAAWLRADLGWGTDADRASR